MLWGGLGGVAAGGLQHLSFLSKLNDSPLLAQNSLGGGDPIYSGGTFNEVTVTAKRNVLLDKLGRRVATSGIFGNLSYLWSGGIENGAIYDRNGYPFMYAPQMGAPDLIGGFAKSTVSGTKLAMQLASEAQMAEKGEIIIKQLRSSSRLAQQYGGKAEDWVKMSSSNFRKFGKSFETHWYENVVTGMKTEFKTKILR